MNYYIYLDYMHVIYVRIWLAKCGAPFFFIFHFHTNLMLIVKYFTFIIHHCVFQHLTLFKSNKIYSAFIDHTKNEFESYSNETSLFVRKNMVMCRKVFEQIRFLRGDCVVTFIFQKRENWLLNRKTLAVRNKETHVFHVPTLT